MPDALAIVAILTACRFHVTSAETFQKAKLDLTARPPALLVTELRLGEFNGLQLVLQGKSMRPAMAAVVISTVPDPVLEADAEAMGATFVLRPFSDNVLAAAVFRTIFHRAGSSDVPSAIRPPFERRQGERRTAHLPVEGNRRATDRRGDLSSLLARAAQQA